jgi:subtilisin family serine protease
VINISLVGPANPALAEAIRRAQAAGVVIVAAAGNEGAAAPPAYPGAFPSVVAVTAVDAKGAVYRYANRGNYISFAAPGVDVPVAAAAHARAPASGTSYASPVVAALIAREVPKRDAAAAAKALNDLGHRARDLGPPGRDSTYGYGVLDATN